MEVDESLVEKVYVHTSIVPNDSIVLDRDGDVLGGIQRDNNNQTQQQPSPQSTYALNLEQQLVNVLKRLVAKTGSGDSSTSKVVIRNKVNRRRRVAPTRDGRVALAPNRNARMF